MFTKKNTNDWFVFPWEKDHPNEKGGIEQNIVRQLQYIGEDIKREGLLKTPKRIVRSWGEIFAGYTQDPANLLTVFDSDGYDQIVLLKDVEMYSTCLSGGTMVETPGGRIPIKYLRHGDWLFSFDEEKNKMVLKRAMNPRSTGRKKQLWHVYTDKSSLLCTADHKILTQNRGWVQAQNLNFDDSIISLNRGALKAEGKHRPYISWTGNAYENSESRYVYQEIHDIELSKNDHVHHKNLIPSDNRPENLKCLTQSKHSRLHRKLEVKTGFALLSEEEHHKFDESRSRGRLKSLSAESRKKRSVSVKAYWDSLTSEQRAIRNHRVLRVEPTKYYEDVWNLDVEGTHNFVANGMVVHNCEHHLLPFFGKAHIAYIPDKKVIGISKLARLVDLYARRAQIQERIGEQVTTALMQYLKPKAAACIIEAQHMCMRMRGCSKQNSTMITSSLKGAFLEELASREELMGLINK